MKTLCNMILPVLVLGLSACSGSKPDVPDPTYQGATASQWAQLLNDADFQTSFQAIKALTEIGEEAIPHVEKIYLNGTEKGKSNAGVVLCTFISESNSTKAFAIISSAARSEDLERAKQGLWNLGGMLDEEEGDLGERARNIINYVKENSDSPQIVSYAKHVLEEFSTEENQNP